MLAVRQLVFLICRFLYPVAVYYWVLWSRLHNLFVKQEGTLLLAGLTPEEAQGFMNDVSWQPDRWYELWDVCGGPYVVQQALDEKLRFGKVRDHSCDCDDFAIWACWTIAHGFLPKMLTVSFQKEGELLPSGHAVCLVDLLVHSAHVGNWGFSERFAREDLQAIALSIAAQAHGRLLGYAVIDKYLQVVKIVRG